MVDVLDPIVKPYEPAIYAFCHGPIVLVISILVELVGVPEPAGSQRSILGRGHQVWVCPEVNTQSLASVKIGARASELYASSASETIPIPRGFIPIAHAT